MSIMEKIAEVNTQLAELRLVIKLRDRRIGKLEKALRLVAERGEGKNLCWCAYKPTGIVHDPYCEIASTALLDPTP
jgi:hypothetical protein